MLVAQFRSQEHLFYVDSAGNLVHRWYGGDPAKWDRETLATGCAVGWPVSGDLLNQELHVYALRSDGSVQHGWIGVDSETWNLQVIP